MTQARLKQLELNANQTLLEKFLLCIKDKSSVEIATFIKALMKPALNQAPELYQDTLRSIIATQYVSAYIKECTRTSGMMSKLLKGNGTLKILDDAIETFNKTEMLFKKYEDYILEDWSKTTEGHVFMSTCDQPTLLQMIFDKIMFAIFHNHREEFVFGMMALGMTGRTGIGLWHNLIKEKVRCNKELMFGNRFIDGFFTETYLRDTLYPAILDGRSTIKIAVAAYYKIQSMQLEEKSVSSQSSGRFFKPKTSAAQIEAGREKDKVLLDEIHRNYPDLVL